MAARRGRLPLFLLLSLAGSKLALGTTAVGATVPTPTAPPVSLLSTAAPTPASSPGTETPTPAMPSTAPGTSSAPLTSAHTAAPPEPSTTVADTTTTSITSTVFPRSTPSPSPPLGSTTETSPGVSTLTTETSPDTSMTPQSPTATPGTEPSSPDTTSAQSPDGTISPSAELPPACPSTPSNATQDGWGTTRAVPAAPRCIPALPLHASRHSSGYGEHHSAGAAPGQAPQGPAGCLPMCRASAAVEREEADLSPSPEDAGWD
ncbi:vegetative cell wall protein gp1 isoform X2 [Gallus gallus]|uniref:vegetative cell wall protein gp1 isoform X2 n=1 Tax=Gallus gallus TaxID=9031 RepID=UPI001F023F44|nr:vegetative cell wall protein gp1 isoform X2 [Gallus gallus]